MAVETLSVIIATYGTEEWANLARSVAMPSALHQGAPEVILEHDGSDGATLACVRNRGARQAKGDLLVFLDADDELAPGYVDAMTWASFESARASGFDAASRLLVPHVQYVEPNGTIGQPKSLHRRPLIEMNYAVIGTCIPRALFNAAGGFRDLPMYEDWDLWLTCEEYGAEFVEVPEAVYVAHRRPQSRNEAPVWKKQRVYREVRDVHLARRMLAK